jgi:hypothetical protein
VKAGEPVVLDLSLPPSTYSFHVDAFADGSEQTELGSGTAQAQLKAGLTTDVMLIASVDASGSAQVDSQVNIAPEIDSIDVQTSANGSAAGSVGAALAQVHVNAVDPEGGTLSYFWSGFGIDGAVQGSSTIALSATAAAGFSEAPVVHVIVQDSAGATTAGSVTVSLPGSSGTGSASAGTSAGASASTGAGGTSVGVSGNAGGSAGVSLDAGPSVSVSGSASTDAAASVASGTAQSCSDANAQCTASCNAGLNAASTGIGVDTACLAACSLTLAACVN